MKTEVLCTDAMQDGALCVYERALSNDHHGTEGPEGKLLFSR